MDDEDICMFLQSLVISNCKIIHYNENKFGRKFIEELINSFLDFKSNKLIELNLDNCVTSPQAIELLMQTFQMEFFNISMKSYNRIQYLSLQNLGIHTTAIEILA
jgi:Ran GTPase-activating protein (RanGAP) involved in mRNA processing and transport